jgi:rubrerythrin
MSMLTAQCENLRIMARLVRDYDYREISRALREAADTIAALRNRLTETCHNVAEYPEDGFWPSPHFKCSECGASHVSMEYVHYCPNCGRKVV